MNIISEITTTNYKIWNSLALALKTLFTQEMLDRGFLATNVFYASYVHKDEHIAKYLKSVREVFLFLADAIESDEVEKKPKGPLCHSGFRRIT